MCCIRVQAQEFALREAAAKEREQLVSSAPFLTGRFKLLENLKVCMHSHLPLHTYSSNVVALSLCPCNQVCSPSLLYP
jgi:hypothetical protein